MSSHTLTTRAPGLRPRPLSASAQRQALGRAELYDVLFLALHAPLGILLRTVPIIATAHALGVLALGLVWATDRRTVHRTVLAAAYLAGAEVLWRMTALRIVYEYGKYGVVLLAMAAVVRLRDWRPSAMGPIYVLLLLPSISLTLEYFGVTEEARREISFNLSGPLALGVCVFLFAGCTSGQLNLRRLLLALTAPIASISAVVGYSVLRAQSITFSTQSNFVTSGGFGPNQVSAMLGLGAVMMVFLATQTHTRLWRWSLLIYASMLLLQSMLTFSRGGLLNALITIGVLGFHFLRQPRVRLAFFSALLLLGLIGTQVVVPMLDRWTGGYLTERYANLDPGLRFAMAQEELAMWRENPVAGVGPGMAKYHRTNAFIIKIAAHTEYTRLLAEHGLFGALALGILLLLALRAYLRAPTALTRAWVAVMAGWALLEMSHAAMRIAAISLVFGLAMIRWPQPPPQDSP